MSERPRSMAESVEEFRKAWRELKDELAIAVYNDWQRLRRWVGRVRRG